MSMNDPLSAALSKILNYERIGRKRCSIKPGSILIRGVLKIMNENRYIGSFKEVANGKGNFLVVSLVGNINRCGAIKPRFSCRVEDIVKYEKRFLLAKDFGILIISTPKGLMTHEQAKKQNSGGRLIVLYVVEYPLLRNCGSVDVT